MSLFIRWLGVNGFHIRTDQGSILIDPYFSRVPFYKMWFGKVKPDLSVIQSNLFPADAILVSHAHIDHLLDVPVLAQDQDIPVYGSHNTCQILSSMNLPEKLIQPLHSHQIFRVGEITITVFPASHIYTPGFLPGSLPEEIHPPLKARQYTMDENYAFQIQASGFTILTDPGHPLQTTEKVDVLILFPFHSHELLEEILLSVKPDKVIPSHWDDFWRPLSKPVKPMIQPPQKEWPPVRRANLQAFARQVEKISPATTVIRLDRFEEVELHDTSE